MFPRRPSYPPGRLAFYAGMPKIVILLTQPGALKNASSENTLPRLPIYRLPLFDCDCGGPTPHSLAHRVYTSGSRAKPKG